MQLHESNCQYLIGMLPTRRDALGSATDSHGFVISSNTDGAMYVKPCHNRRKNALKQRW